MNKLIALLLFVSCSAAFAADQNKTKTAQLQISAIIIDNDPATCTTCIITTETVAGEDSAPIIVTTVTW